MTNIEMITLTVDRFMGSGFERKVYLQPAEISSIEEAGHPERWASTVTMRNGTVHHVDQTPTDIALGIRMLTEERS